MSVVLNRPPDPDVRDAIEMTVMCQEFNCLPNEGGLLDQDSYYVWLLMAVIEAQAERQKIENKRLEKQRERR